MKLITKEIATALPHLGTTDGKDPKDIKIAFKLFTPDAQCSWYITEGNLETGELFGWANLGDDTCAELGYMDLNELMTVRGRLGLPVERDMHFEATLAEVMNFEKR